MKDFLKTIFCLNCQTQLGGWQRHYPLSPSKCDLISSDVVWSDCASHHLVQFHVLFSAYVFVKTLKAMQHILWLRQAFWGQQHGAQWNLRLKRWSPKIGLFSNGAFQLQDFLFKLSEGIHDQRASQVGGNRLTWKSGYLETTVFFWFFLLWVSRVYEASLCWPTAKSALYLCSPAFYLNKEDDLWPPIVLFLLHYSVCTDHKKV